MTFRVFLKPYTIGIQVWMMSHYFPHFRYNRKGKEWVGHLQPSPQSQNYKIRIYFRMGHHYPPRVYVLEPEISSDAPHVYRSSNNALCLYYPRDESWSFNKLIAKTIVPWTAEWLRYYEIWYVTGRWFGTEAPHRLAK